MNAVSVLAVFCGAGCGAVWRWSLGLWLNPVFPTVPLGTLAANLIGGFLVGVANAYFLQHSSLSGEWRLLVLTGFLGGLTTFSTFSAEVVGLINQHQYGWALGAAAVHLLGSLTLTALGLVLANSIMGHV